LRSKGKKFFYIVPLERSFFTEREESREGKRRGERGEEGKTEKEEGMEAKRNEAARKLRPRSGCM
jgi:hypothetical protein